MFRRGARCRQPHLGHPHGAGLVHSVHAAAASGSYLRLREADASVLGALHAVKIAVGGGGVRHPVVQCIGDPAGEILRQKVRCTAPLKVIDTLFFAADQFAAQPPGAWGEERWHAR